MTNNPNSLFDEALEKMLSSLKDEDQMTEKQRRILETAIELFAEKGFHASSTSEIARRAGVAEGTIFKHFKTKTDLLYALIAPMFIKFATPLILKDIKQIIGADLPTDTVLLNLYRNRFTLVEENWPRMRIILQEAFFNQDMADTLLENVAKQARDLAETFIKARMATGEFRDLPVKSIIHATFSMILGYVFFSKAFPEEYGGKNTEQDLHQAVDILMHGIANKRPGN